jgi:hypothetical protein
LRKALKKRKVKKGVAGDFSYTTTPVEFYGGSEVI